MNLENILGKVIDAITPDEQEQHPQRNVRPASEDPYGDPADQGHGQRAGYAGQDVLPASQDPYGDPADGGYRGQDVLPASQDPFGDPADQQAGQQVRPASEDPYGDPADQETPAGGGRGRWPF